MLLNDRLYTTQDRRVLVPPMVASTTCYICLNKSTGLDWLDNFFMSCSPHNMGVNNIKNVILRMYIHL